MTVRKFFLLLAEWQDGQRAVDARVYRLLAVHMKEPPEPGDLFPLLRARAEPEPEDGAGDETIFQQVAASLGNYGG